MSEERLGNFEFAEVFKRRTKVFALRVVKLFQTLSNNAEAQLLGKQLLRAATSVAANYRAACRARSAAAFTPKIGFVLEEADESLFWLELLEETGIIPAQRLTQLKQEANELTAILTTIRKSFQKKKATL
ncbi:four helix bundle protein [Pontibacter sp. E15-1]|uniref:four helix bundle protein n=1 Tax=Pontibacter sp. E15-1 TaxID=2919918 RepID=UPI001F5010F7|nr:four helix bundle protein [Pontibacter sp. E15-1]MCJ8167292.1 four helix bundle protein [Pontibacter sp. E15-1]